MTGRTRPFEGANEHGVDGSRNFEWSRVALCHPLCVASATIGDTSRRRVGRFNPYRAYTFPRLSRCRVNLATPKRREPIVAS